MRLKLYYIKHMGVGIIRWDFFPSVEVPVVEWLKWMYNVFCQTDIVNAFK